MSVFRKIIQEHLREGEMEAGEEIGIQIDQVLIQDITGTVVMLNFEGMGLSRVKCRVAAAYGDHNVLQVDSRNTEDHLYLASAGRKYGIWWAKPSSGIGHQIHQEHFAIPGVTAEVLPAGALVSRRTAPPVFGVGLIESIPEATILANADPGDADGDGISGRPNMITAADFVPATEVGGGPGFHVGRFGLKANNPSLIEQSVSAYLEDMGITSDFAPEEIVHPLGNGVSIGDNVPDPEIPASTVQQTVMYIRLLAPPARGPITSQVQQGEGIFGSIGCAKCHTPTMKTGPHVIPQLSNVDVNLYSDLLLHDMGPTLADNRPDKQATGTEWKTRPLWGLRLVSEFLGGQAFYLHDSRATTLSEAITLHGGMG